MFGFLSLNAAQIDAFYKIFQGKGIEGHNGQDCQHGNCHFCGIGRKGDMDELLFKRVATFDSML